MTTNFFNGKVKVSKRGGMTGVNFFGFVFLFHDTDALFRKIFDSYLYFSK